MRRPRTTLLVSAAIAAGLVLVGLAQLARVNVDAATARWGAGVHMIVYLEDGIDAERTERIRTALDQIPAVAHTEVVPPERALEHLRESLGEQDDLVAGVEDGLLPASIEVTLRDGVRDVAAAAPVRERLQHTRGVAQVEFLGGWVDRMVELRDALDRAAWILLLVVGVLSALAAAAALRLAAPARRDEEAALLLLGARRGRIVLPRLLEGAIEGVLGAGLATGALWLLWRTLGPRVGAALGAAFGGDAPAFLAAGDLLLLAAAGALIGLVGSAAAARRVIR
ncbi:MAG TPA: permease-like cell division protein FtsX [Kofleriaceae bacterium]|nr:permease-like cell division protein FtsX [Kofleriaceae bacterium]